MQEDNGQSIGRDLPDTLYHYCSTDTFKSIIENGNIWLSALDFSNDFMEGALLKAWIPRRCRDKGVPDATVKTIEQELARVHSFWVGYGFCLSTQKDNLGQWRGYADDAQGFSIGFSGRALKTLLEKEASILVPLQQGLSLLEPVEYVDSDMAGVHEAIEQVVDDIVKCHTDPDAVSRLLASTSARRYLYKPSGFREEQEWRILAAPRAQDRDQSHFRTARNCLVPYLRLSFRESQAIGGGNVVVSVTTGPKQRTPNEVVQSFLKKSGLKSVTVDRSTCSYQ